MSANYFIINFGQQQVYKTTVEAGSALHPATNPGGNLIMAESGLQIIIGQLQQSFQPVGDETEAEAANRVKLALMGAATPEDLFENFGLTLVDPE